jgi:hypothetical protein
MISPIKLTLKKIITILICALLSFCLIYTVSAQSSSTVMNAEASTSQPHVGSTLTLTLKISNVQNLAGIDATLQWNSSVLSLSNVVLNLGVESHSNGVLHGNELNYDSNTLSSGDIYVQEEKVSGSYHLVAQSVGQATPGFTGSGTIATLTFNVTSTGPTGLALEADLADHPAVGETANLIDHQDTVDSVTAVIPEFPSTTILALFIALATAAIILTAKQLNKNKIMSNAKEL